MTEFSFDSLKQNGFKNTLTYRGEQKRSGVSYDYMDKLNTLVDKGIFVDKDGDGFTNAEKKALESEFFAIHKEKGYKTNFKTMKSGTSHEYTYDEFIRFAQAAGYVLKEQPSQVNPTEIKPVEIKSQEEQQATVTNPVVPTTVTEEGQEPISQSGKEKANAAASTLSDGEYTINFDGTDAYDNNGNLVARKLNVSTINNETGEQSNVTLGVPKHRPNNTTPDALVPPTPADKKLGTVENPVITNSTPVTTPNAEVSVSTQTPQEKLQSITEQQNALNQQIRDAEQTSYTVKGKKVLGIKFKKDKTVNYTSEELAQRQANLPSWKAQVEELELQKVYTKEVEAGKYWSGKYSPESTLNPDGTVAHKNDTYERIETADGKRLARIATYNKETLNYDYTYYEVKAERVGTPDITKRTYVSIVPDYDRPVENPQLKK